MDFKRRPAKLADLPAIEAINTSQEFEIGLHNVELYFNLSPHTWFVIVNSEDEVIGYDAYNDMRNGLWFGYVFVISAKYRNLKLSHLTAFYGRLPPPIIGNANQYSIDRFSNIFYGWGFKLLHYAGIVDARLLDSPKKSSSIEVINMSKNIFDLVCDYDKSVSKVDRKEFLVDWLLSERYSTARVAMKDGNVVGFGVCGELADFYGLYPCYADSINIGEKLVAELIKTVDGKECYFSAVASSRVAVKIAGSLKMKSLPMEMRVVAGLAIPFMDSIDFRKVVTLHDYFSC